MANEEVLRQLAAKRAYGYFRIVLDKTNTTCKVCLSWQGKTFREDEVPRTPFHPNCRCEPRRITDPAELAVAKFMPKIRYEDSNQKDFNRNRKEQESTYGRIIDGAKFSAPGYELERGLQEKTLGNALYDHIRFREGEFNSPYLDGKFFPSIGIGANMTTERVIKRLLSWGVLTEYQASELRKFGKLDENQRENDKARIKSIVANVQLSERQMYELYVMSYNDALEGAYSNIVNGGWEEKTVDGETVMVWDASKVDREAWEKLPKLVQAICIDIAFNAGADGLRQYRNFLKAVKAGDYRRAAIELVDSRDYQDNVGKRETGGLAKRRRDAAIELTRLAEELEARRRVSQ